MRSVQRRRRPGIDDHASQSSNGEANARLMVFNASSRPPIAPIASDPGRCAAGVAAMAASCSRIAALAPSTCIVVVK